MSPKLTAGSNRTAPMTLNDEQRRAFHQHGYIIVRQVIPRERVERALRLINASLGRGVDPARLAEFSARSFCPELRQAPEILELFEATPARPLADSLVAAGGLRPPAQGQIALRFPTAVEAPLPRPHVDGTYAPLNAVQPGQVAHFTLLAMVALSDVDADFRGNFTVWPGSHHLYEGYFRQHDPSDMAAGTPQLDSLPAPLQTRVEAGDLLLAHYQLGHAAAPNHGPRVRYAVFFRLYHRDHDAADTSILADIWREYRAAPALLATTPSTSARGS
jgi:ectoine hydroxylase-related dioxygenase (phytanoyl-CoA dioxygenase family)